MGDYTIEIIVFVIIVLVVASKPYGAMQAAESILGKFVLLAVVVVLALKSTIAGLLGALLLIVLSEGMREGLANKGGKNKKNKKDAKEEKAKKDDGNAEKGEAAKSAAGGKKAKAQGEKADKKPPATKADQLGITETMEKLQKLAAITNKLS